MKKFLLIAAAASVMLAAISCSEDKTEELAPTPPPTGVPETLIASAEQQYDAEVSASQPQGAPSTRTTLENAQVIWTADEQIRVFNKANTTQTELYTLQKGAGTPEGEFIGNSVPGAKYAFYPTTAYTSITGSNSDAKITFNLPATQTYLPDSFADKANPMIGQGDADNIIRFRNLCGAIKLKLTGAATITQITMTVPAGKIYGAATVDASSEAPVPVFTDVAAKTITLSVPNVALSSTATPFYFVVPAGSYMGGLSFNITDSEGYTMVLTTKSATTVNRSKVAPLKQLPYTRTVAFPDPEFRKMLVDTHKLKLTADATDININDAANKAVFTSITEIICRGTSAAPGNIASLQGIEHFTALKTLDCSFNKVETLNVSQNKELLNLLCYGNNISTLDISTLSKLDMKSINVGTQTNRTLHLTMTPEQRVTMGKENTLQGNANISGGFFPDAAYRASLVKNQKMVETTDGTDIDMLNAETYNQLHTLPFMAITAVDAKDITSLEGTQYFAKLATFYKIGSGLTSFDTALLPATITTIAFTDGNLTSIKFDALANNTILKGLWVWGNKLKSVDISMLNTANLASTDNGIQVGKQQTGNVELIMSNAMWTDVWVLKKLSSHASNTNVSVKIK